VLERWTRAVVHYRAAVVAAWVVVAILGLLLGSRLSEHLTTSLAVPASGSAQADAILSAHFGENIEGTFTVVLPFDKATAAEIKSLEGKVVAAAAAIPTGKVTQEKAIGGVLYANVGTSFNLLHAAALTESLRNALANEGLVGALVTGPPALQHDITPVLSSDLHYGAILALLLALLLLVLVLGLCWAILVPFLIAGATTAAAVAVVFLLSQHFLMILYIPNVIELIGLGLAIDYSLLIVHRFRGEIAAEGVDVEDALVKTMATAGRTVVLSGFAVAIGLATLFLVPVPFVRSFGAAGLMVPVVSLIAALTLQPALLSLLGRRGVSPVWVRGLMARRDVLGGAWARIARVVIRRPITVLVSSATILVIAASPVLWLHLTPGSVIAVPSHLESSRALALVSQRAGPGIITPNEVVIDLGGPNLANTPSMSAARLKLAMAILHDPKVFVVAMDTKPPFVDSTGRYERLFVMSRHEFGNESSQQLVHELRDVYLAKAGFPAGTKIYLGGVPAQGVDFLSSVYGAFPWIVLLALVLAYLVLLRAFRSLVLPLVAVLLDLFSVAAAYGLLVVVFRFGVGSSILGTYHVSQIDGWVPIFIFAMLFGLSMDYEVFIVSRMREAWDRKSSNADAIIDGLAHTGGVVTAAAIILVGALSGLVFGHIAALQELGVGLALGVLIDATIVRGLLLPSIMALLGRWNWWLPNLIANAVQTKASPLEIRGTRL
jgi:uncharacterized membrane protein YdfJ with MMPL/SSD domain